MHLVQPEPGRRDARQLTSAADDLLAFLRTGEIHELRLGATRADVLAALGEPQDTSVSRRPLIRKYGGTELTFEGDEVTTIAVSVDAEADALRLRLDREGPSYEPYAPFTYDKQVAFVAPASGVILTLNLERPLARAFAVSRR